MPSKSIVRKHARGLRDEYVANLSAKSVSGACHAVLDQFLPILQNLTPQARCIGSYHPLCSEFPVDYLHEYCDKNGIEVAFPVYQHDGQWLDEMYFSKEAFQHQNGYGALQKPTETDRNSLNRSEEDRRQPDILIVPVLQVNSQGYRLGMGKGYYDRYTAKHNHIMTVGVGWDCQMTTIDSPSELVWQVDSWDQKLGSFISPGKISIF